MSEKTNQYYIYKDGKLYTKVIGAMQAEVIAYNQKASVYYAYNGHETFINSYE